MNSSRLLLAVAIIGKLILSVLICSYFWDSIYLNQIKFIPIYVLIYAVVYIGLQLLTRRISLVKNWWDWVYYAGLVSIMLPSFFASKENEIIFHFITDYGTLCLLLPTLVDGWNFVNKATKQTK